MNEIYIVRYAVLHKLRYLNMKFKYTPGLHRANDLSFSVKKGDTKHFLYNGESYPDVARGCN